LWFLELFAPLLAGVEDSRMTGANGEVDFRLIGVLSRVALTIASTLQKAEGGG